VELELLTLAKKDFDFNVIKSNRYLSVASILVNYIYFSLKITFIKCTEDLQIKLVILSIIVGGISPAI